MMAAEIRAAVSRMPERERESLVRRSDTDPAVLRAVLTAPAMLSGISPQTFGDAQGARGSGALPRRRSGSVIC
jgi:hypothetical protein